MDRGPVRRIADRVVRIFTENFGLKALALALAVGFFAVQRVGGSYQRVMEVPLLVRLPDATARRVLLTDLPEHVRVTLRGVPAAIRSLRQEDLDPIEVDLSRGQARNVALTAANVTVPAGITVVSIERSSIDLQWDDLVERTLPVRVDVQGAPGAGLVLAAPPVPAPAAVHVTGPSMFVDAMDVVRTAQMDLSPLPVGEHVRRLPLEPARPYVHFDPGGPVRVQVTLATRTMRRTVPHVSVVPVGNVNVQIHPPSVAVVIDGPPEVIDRLAERDLVPVVETAPPTEARGSYRASVRISSLPSGVRAVLVEPNEVIVSPAHAR